MNKKILVLLFAVAVTVTSLFLLVANVSEKKGYTQGYVDYEKFMAEELKKNCVEKTVIIAPLVSRFQTVDMEKVAMKIKKENLSCKESTHLQYLMELE